MYKMVYSNTIRRTGEKVITEVAISNESLAKKLIAKWNKQAETFNFFHYELVRVEWLNNFKNWKKGIFSSLNDYSNPSGLSFRG